MNVGERGRATAAGAVWADIAGAALLSPIALEAAKPLAGAKLVVGWTVETVTGRAVRSIVFATRSRRLTEPRGTPNPAEPGLIVRRSGAPYAGSKAKPRPTITV